MSELPKGWDYQDVGSFNNHKGKNIKPSDFPDEVFEVFSVPTFASGKPEYLKGSDIGSSKQVVQSGDVLVCKINPRINRVWVVPTKGNYRQIASSEWINVRNEEFDSRYLKYAFTSQSFRDLICSEVTGVGGSLTRAQPKKVAGYKIPVAPIHEQKRIADKLDSVLAKAEAAQARLDKIPSILKRFRQSVLAAATSGELSELNIDSWKQEKLIDILEVMADCPHTTPKWTETGKICVRTSQFERFNLKLEESKFVSEETFLSRNSRHTPEAGDILYSREGAILGIACQIPEGVDLCLGQRMIVMRPNSIVNAEFLTLVLNSPLITNYIKTITIGNAAPRINMGTIKQFLIPVPSLKEQEQIVEKAGLFFELANTVESQYNTAKARLDKLNQSILARAFKGELFARSVKSEIKDIENSVEAIHA